MATITTHIAAVRTEQLTQMAAVCEILGWTKQQYCEHQFEEYLLFLSSFHYEAPEIATRLKYSPVFRGFYNNEWALRNEHNFLPFAYDVKYDRDELLKEYEYINGYMTLIHDEGFYNRFENILKLI